MVLRQLVAIQPYPLAAAAALSEDDIAEALWATLNVEALRRGGTPVPDTLKWALINEQEIDGIRLPTDEDGNPLPEMVLARGSISVMIDDGLIDEVTP